MKSEIVNITPEIAKQMLAVCGTQFQRPVSKRRVSRYASEMRAGLWIRAGGGPIEIVKDGLRQWLVNGQHRLSAVVESETTVQFVVLTHSGSLDDARRIYASYDIGGKRNLVDVTRDHATLQPDDVKKINGALVYLNAFATMGPISSISNLTLSLPERVDILDEWAPHFATWRAVRGDYDFVTRFDNGSVIASALWTLRHAPEMASAFWRAACSGEAAVNTGERKLRDYLLGGYHGVKGNSSNDVRTARLRACSICWNASFNGIEIKQLKLDRISYPITFAGTPLV